MSFRKRLRYTARARIIVIALIALLAFLTFYRFHTAGILTPDAFSSAIGDEFTTGRLSGDSTATQTSETNHIDHAKTNGISDSSSATSRASDSGRSRSVKDTVGPVKNTKDSVTIQGDFSSNNSNEGVQSESQLRTDTGNSEWAAMCSMVKDEDLYIDDWVDYHLALGFEHIYIYDTHPNFTLSSWHVNRQTKEAKEEGHGDINLTTTARRIHLTHHAKEPVYNFQENLNNVCIDRLRTLPKPPRWAMLLDTDEYLVIRNMDRYPNVIDFFTDHVQSGILQLNWVTMGTGHNIEYRDEPVTRRFQYAVSDIFLQILTKPAAVLDHAHQWHVHHVTPKEGYTSYGMGGRIATPGRVENGDISVAGVFHYKYKSFDEFQKKQCGRGDIMFERVISCPCFVLTGDRWDDAAWRATKRLLPRYAELDTSSSWTPIRVEDDPSPGAALCSVMTEEDEPYLEEWLDYHLALGFQKIYIYGASDFLHKDRLSSNVAKREEKEAHEEKPPSTDSSRRISVIYRDPSWNDYKDVMMSCQNEIVARKSPLKWIMELGISQFLVIRDMDRYPSVAHFLTENLSAGTLLLSRIVMGNANETSYRDEPVTQIFQYAVSGSHHPETKPVSVVEHISILNHFSANNSEGYVSVDLSGRTASDECCITDGNVSVAAVYDFMYKSMDEYNRERCSQRSLNCAAESEPGDVFDDSVWQAMTRLVPKYKG